MARFFGRLWDRAQGKLDVARICEKVFDELAVLNAEKNAKLLEVKNLHVATLMVYNSINRQLVGPHKDPPCMQVVKEKAECYGAKETKGITQQEFRELIMEWVRMDLRLVLANKAAVAVLAAPLLAVTAKNAGNPVNMNSDTEKHTTAQEIEAQPSSTGGPVYDVNEKVDYDRAGAIEAEEVEHRLTVLQAVKAYPAASWWAFVMSCTIIMESYCVFLMGQFVATKRFARDFGVQSHVKDEYIIEASWQSAFQCSGPVGAFIGVFIAGPITSWIGYRWATIGGLMALNGFIFIFYFGNSNGMFFASQILEGIPWGIFIANAPAYCAEIVPMRLRAPATQMLQMFWAIGSIIVGGITYHYQSKDDPSAYRVPIALQWIFPTPLAILIFIAPESPWWLVRKGRLAEAEKAVSRLGRADANDNPSDKVAMMRRTIELEKSQEKPSLVELWKGTDLYRTLIVCGVYASQNLTGNLIANQAVFFFKQAGMADNTAFALGLITSALQWIMVMLSWILTTYLGRRTIYVYGQFINCAFLVALGIAASVGRSDAASNAQASLGLIVSVLFCLGPAPASWVIIGETPSVRLRPLTTGIGRGAYYMVNIPCIFLSSYMLNTDKWDLGGKSGYIWAGTALFCSVMSWMFIPEMKHRSFREIDILFNRHVPARKWSSTVVDIRDDE